jgi:hypothetical protein
MSLSREDKIALIQAAQEKRKRKLLAHPAYNPNAGQAPVHECKAAERWVFSGNSAGKSTLLVNEVMAYARGYNPWTKERYALPARIIVVLDNSRKIEERFIPELRKWHHVEDRWLKRLGKPYTSRIELDNGSTIDFYTQEADPSSFEGIESSFVAVDENIPRSLYVALKRSLRIKGHPCRFLFCGTPVSQPWLRRDVYEPWSKGMLKDVECFRTSSDVNKQNVEKGFLERFAQGLSESEAATRLRGEFFDAEGMALSHLWRREHHIIPDAEFIYDERMPCVVAVDPHTVKPHHAVMLTVDKQDNLYVIKELSRRSVASKFAEELLEWSKDYKVISWVCDSFGSASTTSFEGFTSFIDKLNQCGVPIRATTYDEKNAEDFVDRLRTLLLIPEESDNFGQRIPKLRVLASCKGLISDIESAVWQKNRSTGEYKPILDTSAKDYLSCLGYALALGLFYDKQRRMRPHYITKPLYGVTGDGEARAKARIIRQQRYRSMRSRRDDDDF